MEQQSSEIKSSWSGNPRVNLTIAVLSALLSIFLTIGNTDKSIVITLLSFLQVVVAVYNSYMFVENLITEIKKC